MIADLFRYPKMTFLTIQKQQTLNFSVKFEVTIFLMNYRPSKQTIYQNDPLGALFVQAQPRYNTLMLLLVEESKMEKISFVNALTS